MTRGSPGRPAGRRRDHGRGRDQGGSRGRPAATRAADRRPGANRGAGNQAAPRGGRRQPGLDQGRDHGAGNPAADRRHGAKRAGKGQWAWATNGSRSYLTAGGQRQSIRFAACSTLTEGYVTSIRGGPIGLHRGKQFGKPRAALDTPLGEWLRSLPSRPAEVTLLGRSGCTSR